MEAVARTHNVVPMPRYDYMRGDIYMVDLNIDSHGREQRGYRPCVIVSNNIGNKFSPIVTVIPITSSKKDFKCHVPVVSEALDKDSVVTCEQVKTVDKTRLKNRIQIHNSFIDKIKICTI